MGHGHAMTECSATQLPLAQGHRSAMWIESDFRRKERLVSSARRFLSELYETVLASPDAAFEAAMTLNELLENLAKYSDGASSRVEVRLDVHDVGTTLTVRTRNSAAPERLAELCRTLDRIAGADDAMALYDDFMQESSRRTGSGLGLARIYAETNLKLSYTIEGNEVTIVAHGPVKVRECAC